MKLLAFLSLLSNPHARFRTRVRHFFLGYSNEECEALAVHTIQRYFPGSKIL